MKKTENMNDKNVDQKLLLEFGLQDEFCYIC